MPHYKSYPPAIWAKIRNLWMSGNYTSLRELYRYCKSCNIIVPPIAKIREKMRKDGDWDREELYLDTARRIEEVSQQLFVEAHLPHRDVIEAIVGGIRGCQEAVRAYTSKHNRSRTLTEDDKAEILVTRETVRHKMLAWIEQYKLLVGADAPSKRTIEIDMGAKWQAAQDAACNEAYRRRFQAVAEAEVVEDGGGGPAKSGENDEILRENTTALSTRAEIEGQTVSEEDMRAMCGVPEDDERDSGGGE